MSNAPFGLQKLINQHARIPRLTFSNNDDTTSTLLVNTLDTDESMSRDFEFAVEQQSDDPSLGLEDVPGKLNPWNWCGTTAQCATSRASPSVSALLRKSGMSISKDPFADDPPSSDMHALRRSRIFNAA